MSSINKRFFILSIMLIFSVSSVFAQTFGKISTDAGLTTEKRVYGQGETVVIKGSGFAGFEEITIKVEQYDELSEQNILHGAWTVFADGKGNFSSNWEVLLKGNFTITGSGSKSGQEVQTVIAASVTPVLLPGNPSCATLNASSDPAFAHITSNWGWKYDAPTNGTFTYTNATNRTLTGGAPADPANSLTISNLTETTFDWSSTRSISALIVKAGPAANVYPYNPASFGDTNLNTGNGLGVSHIEVCFGPAAASITIIKDAQPNSPQSFGFTATGQVNQNFSLVDNGIVGPDRIQFTNLTGFGAGNTVTVTEGASAPFSLTQINCTSNGTGVENNSINVPARFVTIQLEAGENVVCTFVNAVTTTANVSASGKVMDAYGYPIARTRVTIQNASNGEIQTIYTNTFGNYRFENLPAGGFFIVSVSNKRYVFSQNTQIFTLTDAVENVDFTADLE